MDRMAGCLPLSDSSTWEKYMRRIVERKVKSLKDQTLNTSLESYFLIEGEVCLVRFKNEEELQAFVNAGFLIEADDVEDIGKVIPIIGIPEMQMSEFVDSTNSIQTVLITEDGEELPLVSL